jgi:serine/threonine protein kinase
VATDLNLPGDDWIGNYRYIRTLHQGQNSSVMEVVDKGGRRFVMKQLLASKSGVASERRAFEFEAKLGSELRHPNLIKVYEYVKDKTQPFFVMDYFPSTHLRLYVAKPDQYKLPPGRLHWMVEQAAAALAYMHDKGWIHRDVKPENIIVNRSGEVRVIDYALAMRPFGALKKLFGGKAPRQGTLSYLSPEQIRCEPPSPSADVYSFGITCYELACGRQPFRANSANELLNKHLREMPTPLATMNKAVTPEYSDLVMRMLKKKPADRISNLHEFQSLFSRIRIFKDDPDPQADRA